MHPVDLSDALLAVLHAIEHSGTCLETARIDTNIREFAEVRVCHDLEGQRREGLFVIRLTLNDDLFVAHLVPRDRRDVQRAWQVGDDCVQHRLHALVLERRTGEDRSELVGKGRAADCRLNLLDRGLLTFEELLEDQIICIREGGQHFLSPLRSLINEIGRDVLDRVILTLLCLATPGECSHRHEIDDAKEI